MNSDREKNTEETPTSQAVLRSLYNLPYGMEFDVTGFYVAGVPWYDIDSYYRVDARLGWHCTEALVFSLVGQNILDDHHPEFLPDGAPYQTEIESSVYGKMTWMF